MQLALMITCLADVLRPEAGIATVRLLRRLGHDVCFPERQTCCGQPLYNSGFLDLAREQARHTIRTFEDYEAVVVPSGSCAAMVCSEFPRLLEDDDAWRPRAEQLAERTFELADFLVHRLGVVDVGAKFRGRVTYHFACHLRSLPTGDAVEELLRHVRGATYVPLTLAEQCCGFGGSFSVRYPEISGAMVESKCQHIVETGADVVISTDTGCLMNIGGRLHRENRSIRTMHLAELLDHR